MTHGEYLVYWNPETVFSNYRVLYEEAVLRDGEEAVLGLNRFTLHRRHTASDQYRKLARGDVVWVVSVIDGYFVLLSRQPVDHLLDQAGAVSLLGDDSLWVADYHVVADDECDFVPIDISTLGPDLRFEGSVDRLPEDFDGKNLQSMRQLTQESICLLEYAWACRLNWFEDEDTPRGSEAKLKVAAIRIVREFYEPLGWEVRKASSGAAYDIVCQTDDLEERVIVKGLPGAKWDHKVTDGEIETLVNDPHAFLWIVTECLGARPMNRWWTGREAIEEFEYSHGIAGKYHASYAGKFRICDAVADRIGD